MARQICSKCGYEGQGKRLGERRGGGLARLLGLLTLLPFHTLWKLGGKTGRQCPNCQLPTMVKVNSDAGRLARHMIDVELGLIQVKKPKEKKVESFGNERPAEKVITKKPVDPDQW